MSKLVDFKRGFIEFFKECSKIDFEILGVICALLISVFGGVILIGVVLKWLFAAKGGN